MSRAVVLNTIEKLNNLLDEEQGKEMIGGGKGKKKAQSGAGIMIPYGGGLVSSPAQFGYGGCGGCMGCHGGAMIAGGLIAGGKCPKGCRKSTKDPKAAKLPKAKKAKKKAKNPWLDFVKLKMKQYPNATLTDIITNPNVKAEYHALVGY
jgi:hypothetical protein